MTTYTKAFFGHANDPHFDLDRAVEAYEWVLSHEDEAPFVVSKMLFDTTSTLMEKNSDYVEKVSKAYISKRIEDVTLGLSRSVSKSATDALSIVELISKAAGDGQDTEWERSQRAEKQMRDASGRFRVMNRRIAATQDKRPMNDQAASRLMNLNVPVRQHLSPEKAAAYQNDYRQVRDALNELRENMGPSANTYIQATYSNGELSDVAERSRVQSALESSTPHTGIMPVDLYSQGHRIVRVEAVADQPMGGAAGRTMSLDALTAMSGSPDFARFATGAGEAYAGSTGEKWRADWTGGVTADQTSGTNRFWRRLKASSQLAREMGGQYLPPKAQFALKVGEWAGNYAPEAEKVIGPTARRAAYRYRGTEKQPNPVYQNEIDTLRQLSGSGREAHKTLIHGYTKGTPKSPKRPELGVWEDTTPSRTIQALKKTLPDPALYTLNRKSGTIPPSQGIIIDRKGEVVTEAVGYGEDWYLPFNLKNMSRLKGGEYIRTRAYGGLTGEDIYAGLVSGARAVTVVSHSGVFTMEFDDTFRGSRRYNDKAARMNGRYGQLLDAVKNGGITLGDIPPDRRVEIEDRAAKDSGDPTRKTTRYEETLNRLLENERKEPQLSQAQTRKIAFDTLNQHVIDNALGGRNFDEYVQRLEATAARRNEDPEQLRAEMASWESAAARMGATDEVQRALDKEQAVYAESLNPLKLNGRGYGKAMEALREQFPYYVADVTYTPWGDSSGRQDKGYVKPRFIRPRGALAGYYDESITGTGKINADRMDYQNSGVPKGSAANDTLEDEDDEPKAAPAARAAEPDRAPRQAPNPLVNRNDATMALVRALRATPVNDPNGDYAAVFGGTEDDVRAMLADSAQAAKVNAQLGRLKNFKDKFPSADSSVWENWERGGAPRASAPPENTMDLINGLGTKDYVLSDVMEDEAVGQYDYVIGKLLGDPLISSLGITAESTPDKVNAAIKERAANLRKLQQAHNDVNAGVITSASVVDLPSEKEIRNEALDLARLSMAFKHRAKRTAAEAAAAEALAARNKVIHTWSDEETAEALAPKADAPDQGAADEVDALKKAAAPYRESLSSMVGMDEVVSQMDKLVARAAAAKRRERLGMAAVDRPMNMVFSGNPGTGKTTVATEIAGLYYDLGLTKEPKFLELTKRDLVGATANDIANTTREQLEQGRGGVILIDEAYSLLSDDYGRQVIDEIVPFITSDAGKETVLIFAGYPDGMKEFRENANPGLKSRLSTVIPFRDYTAAELVQIADGMLAKKQYVASATAKKKLTNAVAQMHASPEFNANGRDVENFINNALDAHDERLMESPGATKEQEQEIAVSDVEYAVRAMGLKSPRKKVA